MHWTSKLNGEYTSIVCTFAAVHLTPNCQDMSKMRLLHFKPGLRSRPNFSDCDSDSDSGLEKSTPTPTPTHITLFSHVEGQCFKTVISSLQCLLCKYCWQTTVDCRPHETLFFGDNFFKLVTIGFKFSHHPFQPKRRYPSIWSLNKISKFRVPSVIDP